jgi:replicative DNA helicase
VAPPHSLEAEQSVLGAILLSDRAMYGLVVEEGLKPEDFYREHHRTIYEAMLSLAIASRSTCRRSASTCAARASSTTPAARPLSTS